MSAQALTEYRWMGWYSDAPPSNFTSSLPSSPILPPWEHHLCWTMPLALRY